MKNKTKSSRLRSEHRTDLINQNDQPSTSIALGSIIEYNLEPSTSLTPNYLEYNNEFNVSAASNTFINVSYNYSNYAVSCEDSQTFDENISNCDDSNDTDHEYYFNEESSLSESGSGSQEQFEESPLEKFQEKLASAFLNAYLSHSQGDQILAVLRTHVCFNNLPKVTKTLLQTPRNSLQTVRMGIGEYYHIELKNEIIK